MSVICQQCGKELSEAEARGVHLCKPAEQPPTGEFVEKANALRRKGATREQWEFATMIGEACDRLDAQQQEIELLKIEAQAGKALWVKAQTARKRLALEVDRLTAENGKEREHSNFMERLLETLIGEGWNKLTIYEAKKRRAENKAQAERIQDYARRILSHIKGEGVEGECRTCGRRFWYVDDEPIACPFCRPEQLIKQALKDKGD